MTPLEKVGSGVFMTLLLLGPPLLLLLLRRWLRQWSRATLAFVLLFPPPTFLGSGGIAYVLTYYDVVVRGDTAVPDELGVTVPQYLGQTFAICGMYGLLISGTGFLLSLPVLLGWWALRRKSFDRFTRRQSEGPSE